MFSIWGFTICSNFPSKNSGFYYQLLGFFIFLTILFCSSPSICLTCQPQLSDLGEIDPEYLTNFLQSVIRQKLNTGTKLKTRVRCLRSNASVIPYQMTNL